MAAANKMPADAGSPTGRRRWLRVFLLVTGVATLVVGSAVGVTALETFQPIQGSKVYDDNDELLTEFHVERRIFMPLAQVPQSLRDAIIATEDKRFYSHSGVDPIGVGRAVFQNYRRGRIVEGGSTITQQLTKLL